MGAIDRQVGVLLHSQIDHEIVCIILDVSVSTLELTPGPAGREEQDVVLIIEKVLQNCVVVALFRTGNLLQNLSVVQVYSDIDVGVTRLQRQEGDLYIRDDILVWVDRPILPGAAQIVPVLELETKVTKIFTHPKDLLVKVHSIVIDF